MPEQPDRDVTVHGDVAPGFEPVRAAFATNLAEGRDVGAGTCLYVDGRPVVDIWGGEFVPGTGQPYDRDTLQLVFSTTKGATAVCVGILADRGLIDYDARVAEYWPEFAANGKADITVAQLLSHQAGLPTIDASLTLAEVLAWDPIVEALAAQAPLWPPGSAFGYHALTYGYLAGELVRRVGGKRIGEFFAAEVAAPLGLDFWIGLPDSEEARVAPLIASPPPPPELAEMMAALMGPDTLGGRALSLNGALTISDESGSLFNRREIHAAEMPAANGITNARSLARMYAACIGEVDGVRLLSSEVVDRARVQQTSGTDQCLQVETTFGMGFMTSGPFSPLSGPGALGHAGAGGSLGFAHPERRLAFGYVMNQMEANLSGDTRVASLIDAAVSCLE
jgi:CubicO group peptidase (beta-lactamase class C family)